MPILWWMLTPENQDKIKSMKRKNWKPPQEGDPFEIRDWSVARFGSRFEPVEQIGRIMRRVPHTSAEARR